MMRQVTQALLSQLQSRPLLQHCGDNDRAEWLFARSRVDAFRRLSTAKFSALQLQLNNRRSTALSQIDYPRFQQWNAVAGELRPLVQVMTSAAVAPMNWTEHEKDVARKSMDWDLATTLLEVEFSDVMPPLFNVSRILPIYEAGHLPCGWTGPKLDTFWAGASTDPVPPGEIVVW